ncbi:MAG: hypothetical protein M1816_000259 [Peltula sp. TS41687]|nr:MAG: hypothetical protein M1816_000259 [Peltula sp. TS41687]
MDESERQTASREAAKGGLVGALRWGFYGAVLGAAGYAFSPVYRNLTVQFKIYLQMSSMILGGWVEADERLREYEARVRKQRRIARVAALRRQEDDLG